MTSRACRLSATAIAKRLLGKDAKLYGEHALLKPSAGPATPWHQDESFRSPDFEYRELSIWLALQPVTKESGCMQFIPGSNHYEVLTHQSPGGDKTLHPLECIGDFPVDQAVAVPLNAGGCTVHHMRTLHHTAPNTTKGLRLAYILIFNVPPVYRPGTRQFPWLEGRRTDNQNRSQEWLRKRGVAGYLTEAVRLLPRARLTNPRWLAWAAIRAASKITRRG
jgi:ectoine hydroxylase-related dioxygenase (phytanoyl-CoA dioxygenase family)